MSGGCDPSKAIVIGRPFPKCVALRSSKPHGMLLLALCKSFRADLQEVQEFEGERMTKRKHRKKWDERLVPIDGERLRAAITHRTITVKGLARQLGESHQALNYIIASGMR